MRTIGTGWSGIRMEGGVKGTLVRADSRPKGVA